ncbi:hypothetical protein KKF04_00580, partial [Patescibacteria group bacterium]|nr:hypothetical protein [Patescibacteria group bacterium]
NESDDEIAFVISSPQVHNLMNCCLAEISSDILFVANIEISPHIRGGKGVGVDFYANLSKEAKKLGYRFLTGYHNDPETARFFINRGRYLVEEVKDELRSHFQVLEDQEDDESVLHTIQFLNPEDVDSFIKPERVGTNADSKIEFRGRLNSLLKS